MVDQDGDGGTIRHAAWFYRTPAEYLAAIEDFAGAGQAAGEAVLIALPHGQLPAGWHAGPALMVADMAELGRNPARIIPALRDFCGQHPNQRVRYLGEPVWAGRSAAELRECARHEALLNLAFAGVPITIMCPYNSAQLPQSVLADARATHPVLRKDGAETDCADYREPADFVTTLGKPLLAPASAQSLEYADDLRQVRALVAAFAQRAGLAPARCTDLVIAANEVAANTLRHSGGTGIVRLWSAGNEVLCQLEDNGFIADPLAGHWRPGRDLPGGQGLWLVNQVCDLAEIRTGECGTTIRLHMDSRQ